MLILIVDDEPKMRSSLAEVFKHEHDVMTRENGAEAIEVLEKMAVDLVITDFQMPKMTGLELIKKGKQISPDTAFMMITAYGSVEQAVHAIQEGADDYFIKPFELSELEHRVRRVLEHKLLKAQHQNQGPQTGVNRLIGTSKSIAEAKAFVVKVADAAAPVLLLGSSGTGKEVMAKAIHESGPRASRLFVAVNCASLNENLTESELFGHEKGAFTGAVTSKPGKFELAKGGTIFLDEIGELSPSLQAKLLRVLQEKEFSRVGGTKVVKSDARVIAATHRNLKEMVKQGTFREDLFFRLNVLTFELKPLHERREDIPALIHHFWNEFGNETASRAVLSDETMEILKNYGYPGNVRELQNVLERLAVLGPRDGAIAPSSLPREFSTPAAAAPQGAAAPALEGRGLEEVMDEVERKLVVEAMEKTNHNQTMAAKYLKITRGALQYKLKKYGLLKSSGDENVA